MFETAIRVTFLSDWQIGSGMGGGPVADSILIRDINGLPYIPGRALKGALREGAWRLGLCRKDLADLVPYLWGTASTTRASNVPGKITVASGHLPEDLTAWLLSLDPDSRARYVSDMTMLRVQTALEDERQIKASSLRTLECGIPGLFFQSHIAIDAPDLAQDWLAEYFGAVCAAVKSIGADRARGLGACLVEPAMRPAKTVTLPAPLESELSQSVEVAQ